MIAESGETNATYVYDAADKMVSGTKSGETSNFTYNDAGTLVKKNNITYIIDHTSAIQ